MKQLNYFARLALDWLMVAVGVLGALFCLITAFDLPATDGILSAVIFVTVLDCLLLSGRRLSRITAPILLAVLVLFGFLLREELFESFRNLWGVLISRYALGYDQLRDLMLREPTSPAATGQALSFLGLVMALPVSCAVRWWKRSFPAALALLPGIVPCFILTDTPPALLPLLAAAASILVQIFSQSVRRREAGEEGKAIGLAALMTGVLLGLLLLLFPQDSFEPPISWAQLSRKMSKWGQEQGNRGNQIAGLAGNPDQVDLGTLGALPLHPVTDLRVQGERDDYLYLRGSSYAVFDGRLWSRGEEPSWPVTDLFPYLQGGVGYELGIESVNVEPLLYTSYQLTGLPAGGQVISDIYVNNPENRARYSIRYTDIWTAQTPEEDYDAWVRETCTRLPDRTREGVLAWWAETDGRLPSGIGSGAGMEEFSQAVATAVSGCAKYSRNPLRVPEGEDFCSWFLNDAEEGYCVHFATACTALLRAMGIPARYVSGYVCTTVAGESVPVTNLQAHAWVEIWSGGRWIPIEPTPDDATEFTGRVEVPHQEGASDTPESTEEGLIHPHPIETLETIPTETRPAHTRPTRTPAASTEPQGPGAKPNPAERRVMTPFWIFLGVIGLLILLLSRRALAQRLRARKLARASVNEKARLLYRWSRRLQRLGAGTVPEEALRLANKASFSQYELSDEELSVLRQLYSRQSNMLQAAKLPLRIYCKYILAVV